MSNEDRPDPLRRYYECSVCAFCTSSRRRAIDHRDTLHPQWRVAEDWPRPYQFAFWLSDLARLLFLGEKKGHT